MSSPYYKNPYVFSPRRLFPHYLYQEQHLRYNPPLNAEFLAKAERPHEIPRLYGSPEVIVTGRANCGKSTLLNAVLATPNGSPELALTSKKAGCTSGLTFYRARASIRDVALYRAGKSRQDVVIVDGPGYGASARPEWGNLFNTYISTREQLRRIYILFNAKHRLTDADLKMLRYLSKLLIRKDGTQPYTLQSIITKADCIPLGSIGTRIPDIQKQIFEAAPLCLPPIITSGVRPMLGIDSVRANIGDACGSTMVVG